jgi:hypothetical protein
MHFTKLGKLTIYHTFIMSHFDYCPLVWHFWGERATNKIEIIQKRILRFIPVYDDYKNSSRYLLQKSQLPYRKLTRIRTMALEWFKVFNKQTPTYRYQQNFIQIKETPYSFRYTNTAILPKVNTCTTKHRLKICKTLEFPPGIYVIPI